MDKKNITFTLEFGSEWIPKEYYPIPSVKAIPEWYKKMQSSSANNKLEPKEVVQSQTVKRCMPVFDAMTAGYILFTHTDLFIKYVSGVPAFEWAQDTKETVTPHPAYQLTGYRNMNLPNGAHKFRNPWGIKTPKGYSCLFLPPLHRPDCGIRIIEGLVDTDSYSNCVHLPFLINEGAHGTIPAGTPIAQVIPFKRDSFVMEIGDIEQRTQNHAVSRLINSTWINGYRNRFRANKSFT